MAFPTSRWKSSVLDRRLEQMTAEGVQFQTRAHVGGNVPAQDLRKEFDAVLLSGGAENPRDLNVPGPRTQGHLFRHAIPARSKTSAAPGTSCPDQILATGKRVVIIGGGDTGADCLGTAHRQQAKSVHQFEIMPMPPQERAPEHALAAVAAAAAHRKRARRGRQAGLGAQHRKFTGDENGNVKQLACHPRRPAAQVRAHAGNGTHHGRGSGPAGAGLHRVR